MFQRVPNTALFVAHFTGPDGVNASFGVYSRDIAAAWDATLLGNIAEDLADAIDADYMPNVGTDWTFSHVTSRNLDEDFGLVIEHAARNTVGGLGSPSLPAQVSVRGSFIGTPGNPPRRGGIFMLPPSESQVVGSMLSGGAQADLQTALEGIAGAMNDPGPAHVIVSRYSGTTETDGPGTKVFRTPIKREEAETNTVQSVIVRSRVDSQRSRRPAEA